MFRDLVLTYISLYRFSLMVMSFFLWISLSYVDRVHMKERTRRYGSILSDSFLKVIMNEAIYNKIRLFVIRPLCVLSEIVSGFLEGIENLEPILMISSNQNKFILSSPNESNVSDTSNISHMNHSEASNNESSTIENDASHRTTNFSGSGDQKYHKITTRKVTIQDIKDRHIPPIDYSDEPINEIDLDTNVCILSGKIGSRRCFNLADIPTTKLNQSTTEISTMPMTTITRNDHIEHDISKNDISNTPEVFETQTENDQHKDNNNSNDNNNDENYITDTNISEIDKVLNSIDNSDNSDNDKSNQINSNDSVEKNNNENNNNDTLVKTNMHELITDTKNNVFGLEKIETKGQESGYKKFGAIGQAPDIETNNILEVGTKRRKIPIKLARVRQHN